MVMQNKEILPQNLNIMHIKLSVLHINVVSSYPCNSHVSSYVISIYMPCNLTKTIIVMSVWFLDGMFYSFTCIHSIAFTATHTTSMYRCSSNHAIVEIDNG